MPARATSPRLWDLLCESDRRVLSDAGRHVDVPRGTQILDQGAASGSALVLLAGRVKVVADGTSGHQRILAIRVPGDVVGELAAVDGRPRSASVVAIDRVEVLRVPAVTFNAILRTHPGIAHAVLTVVIGKLRAANQRRVEYGDTTVAQRLATTLAELAAEHGVFGARGIAITIPFSQEELAGMVAGSREAVVRALRLLRDDGIIHTGRQQVVILEPEALARDSVRSD